MTCLIMWSMLRIAPFFVVSLLLWIKISDRLINLLLLACSGNWHRGGLRVSCCLQCTLVFLILVLQCNLTVDVFVSLCIRSDSQIGMRSRLLGAEGCCQPLLLETKKSIFFLNTFISLIVKKWCRWWLCGFFFAPYLIGTLGYGWFYFSVVCGWTAWEISWCSLSVKDALAFACSPSPLWCLCIFFCPILLWLCSFIRVFAWGGVHIFPHHISLQNRPRPL